MRIIRIDPSCGYACFWGLFGLLVAFWGVFDVAVKVEKLPALDGRVARLDLYRDKT